MGHAPTSVLCPKCQLCGNQSILDVPHEGFDAWESGVLIQDAFPTLSRGEREMLITGIHPECWDKLFPEEGDDYTPTQEYI